MPRLEPVTRRDQVSAADHAAFDQVFASRGRINAPQSMLMYVPQLSVRANALNDTLRRVLSEPDFELAVLGAAREFDIDFVWVAHVPTAIRAGVSEATIEVVRTRGDLSGLSPREQILISLSRELVGKHQLSTDTFDRARAELGEQVLIEVLTAMGYYLMIGCVLIATDMDLPAGADRLPR